MLNNWDTLFVLLRRAIVGEPVAEQPLKGLELACRLAQKHDLLHLLGDVEDPSCATRILDAQGQALYRAERMTYELDRMCALLEKHHIPHIPLKGAVLRHAYPEVWMRTSCDIDLLVPEKDLDRATNLFQDELHWELTRKGSHDRSFHTDSELHIELHYTLIEGSLVKNSGVVLSTVWNVVESVEGYQWRRRMPDALFYYYHIAHMARHFQSGGCGVRSVMDLWILRHRVPGDAAGRQRLLEEGGLASFEQGMVELSEVWFSSAPYDEKTTRLAEYILRGGTYGMTENRLLIQRVSKGRMGYLISRLFASYENLCVYYPKIKGRRWLIPYAQVRRWGRMLLPSKRRAAWKELQCGHHLADGEYVGEIRAICQDLDL